MNLLLLLLRASRGVVVLAVLAALVSGLSTAGVLVAIRSWMAGEARNVPAFLWAFVGAGLGAVLSKLASQLLLVALSRRAVARLVMHLSRGVLSSPLAHLEELGPARLQTALAQDVQAIAQGLSALPVLAANVAIVAACLGFLGYLSPAALLLVGGGLGVGLLLQLALVRQARGHLGQTREGQEAVAVQLHHLIEGVKELKTHRRRRDAFLADTLQASVDQQGKQGGAGQTYLAFAETAGRAAFFAVLGALLCLPAVAGGSPQDLGGLVVIVFFIMHPLGSLKFLLPQVDRARVSLEKVQNLGLDLTASAEPPPGAVPPMTRFSALELAGLTYSYRPDRDETPFTVGPLDLTFRPGELVFVGGGNGSGKTTFAKLLTGLYAPHGGEIRVDGRAVTPDRLEAYRQLFSVVFAEFHLFPSLLGLDAPGLWAKTQDYLARLHLDRHVAVRNGVFSTTTRLSRGQRKRLALLVAYLEDRPFYVFDEWAADQDPQFKAVFYTDLLPDLKARGKTVLVITHDDRYFHLADRLLILEGGLLRETGRAACEPAPAPAFATNGEPPPP